ncbi:MAG: phosphoadenylyl-sulfate reductase [Ignavibacteria bacterium]|nr:phosphoadenylyl-sulfate reductase [Ignavibacteria bacterium]MBI3765151.1 phosphoadenylyl-sulfate reductase [Ignavibacteriales bacterium]
MTYTEEQFQVISNQFEDKHPIEVLRWMDRTFPIGQAVMATGFGAEGVALIDMLVAVNKNIPIFFLDTEVLFPETHQLRNTLEEKYGIRITRYNSTVTLEQQAHLHGSSLWERDPDHCCNIRKVKPLQDALKQRSAWVTAIRREQSPFRATAGIVEWDKKFNVIKINPLVTWTKKDVWKYIAEHNVPYNSLYDKGYTSIGCIHCTTPVGDGESDRAGRWRGFQKTECGLHKPDTTPTESIPIQHR